MNQQNLPNALTVLILGILSIVTCCCYGVVGVILGGIGLYLASKDEKLYKLNPSGYLNYGNLKTGKILCIIGICLGALYLIYVIVLVSAVGFEALTDQELMQEKIQDLLGQ